MLVHGGAERISKLRYARKNVHVMLREKERISMLCYTRKTIRVMLLEKECWRYVTRERIFTLHYARKNLRVMLREIESLRYGKSRLLERCFEIKSWVSVWLNIRLPNRRVGHTSSQCRGELWDRMANVRLHEMPNCGECISIWSTRTPIIINIDVCDVTRRYSVTAKRHSNPIPGSWTQLPGLEGEVDK